MYCPMKCGGGMITQQYCKALELRIIKKTQQVQGLKYKVRLFQLTTFTLLLVLVMQSF